MSGPPSIVVSLPPATIKVTGVGYFAYGMRYAQAARQVEQIPQSGFDPVVYQLCCQSVELFLKAFIWLIDRKTQKQIKNQYSHDLVKLWQHSKAKGISKYLSPTPLRDQIISLVSPFYQNRRFAYFDLEMIVGGYSTIRSERRALPVLKRLSFRLEEALRSPVLAAS